jgi:predicted ArsR family transcriptional regulator
MRVERKEQGATRQNILQLLRRQGQMTAIELSQSLRIGAVGVRQHLALLERDGLVEVSDLRRSVGRPSHLYTLTPEAERYFPKNYDKLALDVLQQVEEQYGEEAVETILTARRKKIAQKIAPRLAGKSLTEKVLELTHILADMGYMCEYQQYDDGTHVIIEHNCPIDCIARLHPQFCMHEIELYKELLDVGIDRDSTIASDGSCCRYIISASELCVDNDSMSEPCVDNDSMTEQ